MTNTVMGDGVANAHDLPRPVLLNRIDAAEYVRVVHGQACAPKTLAKLASVGGGPPYRKGGKFPVYEPADLDEWARARLSPKITSHSELRALAATRNTRRARNGKVSTT